MQTLQQLFPVNLAARWQNAPANLEHNLADWLYETGSLTARLKRCCQNFRVEVLGQAVGPCALAEATDVILAGEPVLVREVILYCDDSPQVFARSLLPLSSLTGDEQQLANLGNQPLGQVLFNNPLLERKSIAIAPFDERSSVAQLAATLKLMPLTTLWGRRSLFILNNKPILVAEVFLPGAFAYHVEAHA